MRKLLLLLLLTPIGLILLLAIGDSIFVKKYGDYKAAADKPATVQVQQETQKGEK